MRKHLITKQQQDSLPENSTWLDLQDSAEVEISSEQADHPIEAALMPGDDRGWRAADAGKQQIRLLFAEPQQIGRIQLSFIETAVERTQEILLSWSADGGQSFQTIIRQQWNFSPDGSTQEIEDLHVELKDVNVLELVIIPDISGGQAIASLDRLQLA